MHNRRENIYILHEFHPLTASCNVTGRPFGHNFEPFIPRFKTRLLLARLVEAEIVSPYRGILINAGMGNPTVSFTQTLGIGELKGEWGGVRYSLPL